MIESFGMKLIFFCLLATGLLLAAGGRARAAAAPTVVEEVQALLPGIEVGSFTGLRGLEIVYGIRRVPEAAASVVIVNGRNETFVKYREVIEQLAGAGFSVFTYDHRGQGFSGRPLADREKGHVDHFDDYVADLDAFLTRIVKPVPGRCFFLTHSMGGTVALRFVQLHPGRVARMALVAPMLGFPTAPWPAFLVPPLLTLLDLLGFGRSYIISGKGWRPEPWMPDNVLTSDREKYQFYQRLERDHPRLRLGSPTNNWVRESLKAIAAIMAGAGRIEVPILILQAGADRVVDNGAQLRFSRWAPNCRLVVIPGARHEILMETPARRQAAMARIINFFQAGETAAAAAGPPATEQR
jgi:lysophospholipase